MSRLPMQTSEGNGMLGYVQVRTAGPGGEISGGSNNAGVVSYWRVGLCAGLTGCIMLLLVSLSDNPPTISITQS